MFLKVFSDNISWTYKKYSFFLQALMGSCSVWVCPSLPAHLEGLADFQQALTKYCSDIPSDKSPGLGLGG